MTLERKHAARTMSFGEHRDVQKVVQNTPVASERQKRVNVNIDEEKHIRFKAACARKGTNISEVLKEMVDSWLKENE
ncbi:plasmid partition protein ParG [Erwinia sp. V71]|uniref:plasmid partition protein ParG n=1 Tax=Erwinia sp. V71 TaxID=3369424 RepID=UPI003F5D84DF